MPLMFPGFGKIWKHKRHSIFQLTLYVSKIFEIFGSTSGNIRVRHCIFEHCIYAFSANRTLNDAFSIKVPNARCHRRTRSFFSQNRNPSVKFASCSNFQTSDGIHYAKTEDNFKRPFAENYMKIEARSASQPSLKLPFLHRVMQQTTSRSLISFREILLANQNDINHEC